MFGFCWLLLLACARVTGAAGIPANTTSASSSTRLRSGRSSATAGQHIERGRRSLRYDPNVVKLLEHQHRIGHFSRLFETETLGTHNSYCNDVDGCNTKPNNGISMIEQLDLGFRVLNYDIHYKRWPRKDVVFCHYLHGAAGTAECNSERNGPEITQAIRNLKTWLDGHPNDFVIVMIEDKMNKDKRRDKAVDIFRNELGSRMFEPRHHKSGGSCMVPLNDKAVTKQKLIDSGKRVLLTTGPSGSIRSMLGFSDPPCKVESKWRETVWKLTISPDKAGEEGTLQNSNTGYMPQQYLNAVYENRGFCAFCGSEDEISPDELITIRKHGVQILGLDYWVDSVDDNGVRLANLIWSWAYSNPVPMSSASCASQLSSNGRWKNVACSGAARRAACRNAATGMWLVTDKLVGFSTAASECRNLGAHVYFDLPTNGNYNEQLLKASQGAQGTGGSVWVAYKRDTSSSPWKNVAGPPSQCPKGEVLTTSDKRCIQSDDRFYQYIAAHWKTKPAHSGSDYCVSQSGAGTGSGSSQVLVARSCGDSLKAACRDYATKEWKISSTTVSFSNAASTCSNMGDSHYFDMPKYWYDDMEALKSKMNSAGVGEVWIAYELRNGLLQDVGGACGDGRHATGRCYPETDVCHPDGNCATPHRFDGNINDMWASSSRAGEEGYPPGDDQYCVRQLGENKKWMPGPESECSGQKVACRSRLTGQWIRAAPPNGVDASQACQDWDDDYYFDMPLSESDNTQLFSSGLPFETTLAAGNRQAGNQFVVQSKSRALSITRMHIHAQSSGGTVQVYKKSGNYFGHEHNPASWLLIHSELLTTVNPIGKATPLTPFANPVNVPAGSNSVSFYVRYSQYVKYTNGKGEGRLYAENGDIRFFEGIGMAGTFGTKFSPRIWNGFLEYNVVDSDVVIAYKFQDKKWTDFGGPCGDGRIGNGRCPDPNDTCAVSDRGFHCGMLCSVDSSCNPDQWCNEYFEPFICDPKLTVGSFGCLEDRHCLSSVCAGPVSASREAVCGNTCTSASDCNSDEWCNHYYFPTVCRPKVEDGKRCVRDDDECVSQRCAWKFTHYECAARKPNGKFCFDDSECLSNSCSAGVCGSRCLYQSHCDSLVEWCDGKVCRPKKADGFWPCEKDAQCQSDRCRDVDRKCVPKKPKGALCSSDKECLSGDCGGFIPKCR